MNKKEVVFIGAILLAAFLLWAGMSYFRGNGGESIRITVDGEEYGTYSLDENQVIAIHDTNVCEIKDGKVTMTEADCPDHLCMKQKAVDKTGGTIVCLPNKVIIEGVNAAASPADEVQTDAVA